MKPSLLGVSLLIALTLSAKAYSEDIIPYTDLVDSNYEFEDAVYFITEQGYATGYDDGTFRADQQINRAEALKVILNASATVLSGTGAVALNDIVESDWFYPYVQTASQLGIVSGYPDGTFKGTNTVNKAEFLKMYFVALGLDISPTREDQAWYQNYFELAAQKYAITANSSGDYEMGELLTRGEVADIIYRYQSLPYTGEIEYGKATWYHGNYGDIYDATGGYTAAHKTLPFGTRVKVTNLDLDTSIIVTINDRGPWGEGRIIDLSTIAFEEIGSLSTGVLNVKMEVLK